MSSREQCSAYGLFNRRSRWVVLLTHTHFIGSQFGAHRTHSFAGAGRWSGFCMDWKWRVENSKRCMFVEPAMVCSTRLPCWRMSFRHSVFQSLSLEFPCNTGTDMQYVNARTNDILRRNSARRSGNDRLFYGGVDFHVDSNDVISSTESDFSIVANVEEKCYSFRFDNVDRSFRLFFIYFSF